MKKRCKAVTLQSKNELFMFFSIIKSDAQISKEKMYIILYTIINFILLW